MSETNFEDLSFLAFEAKLLKDAILSKTSEANKWRWLMNEIHETLVYGNRSEALNADFDEFLIQCKYHSKDCDKRNFTPFFDKYYGQCYRMLPCEPISNHAGELFSLQMLLNVNQSDYLPNVIEEAGIRISIHEQGVETYLLNNGISISTGFRTNIALRQKLIQRISSNDCDASGKYSNSVVIEDKMIRPCFDNTDDACMKQQQGNPDKCNCRNPCRERQYLYDVTMTRWPSTKYEPVVEDMFRKRNLNYSNFRDNFVFVNIFFSSMTEEVIEEEPAYTPEKFVSDIGGSLGLWIGMSIISLGEIIELCILLFSNRRHQSINDLRDQVDKENNDTTTDQKKEQM